MSTSLRVLLRILLYLELVSMIKPYISLGYENNTRLHKCKEGYHFATNGDKERLLKCVFNGVKNTADWMNPDGVTKATEDCECEKKK